LAIDEKYYGFERSKKEKEQSQVVGLTVARLSPEKGVDCLLQALACLNTKTDWHWVIVGDGWMRPALEKMRDKLGLSERVDFVGSVDAREYYAKADLFVLPSSYEGFGLVLLEAMVNHLPCIGFDSTPPKVITASREIIAHQETGLLAKIYSPESLAACITKLLGDKPLRLEMGERGYQRSIKDFSWDKCVQGYLKITGDKLEGHE
jgi:glycosyltransferase involved in cell wall biosynthesis